jgi:ATP phosphoribosyltransferase
VIVIDGNDGTGKSTLVARLQALGYAVKDRGLPTKATDEGVPATIPEDELYVILDAPESVSRARLYAAGKDLEEKWHTWESLRHYRQRFREVAQQLGVPLIDSSGSPQYTFECVSRSMGLHEPFRLGIPKGRLLDGVKDALGRAGFPLEVDGRNYHPACPGLDAFILKPRSVPQMVALGLLDGGFCGRDLIRESGCEERLRVAADLGTQRVRLVVAAVERDILQNPPARPLYIATEFPGIADRWATGRNLAHVCLNTWGSTEAWCPEYADLVVDVVETGDTMRANGLVILEEIMTSTTVLAVRAGRDHAIHHRLVAALRGA